MNWIVQNQRLVKYGRKASSEFWGDYWNYEETQNVILAVGYDKVMQKILFRYLPQKGKILDAGCGIGKWIIFLRELGYDVEGVDFSPDVINKVKQFDPDIPIKVADVLNLPYADNSFKGYISFGILEHFEDGPQKALLEAKRILQEDAIILISVPYFSPIRKFKAMLNLYNHKQNGQFYQYAFSKNELLEIVRNAGFRIVNTIPIYGLRGMFEEIPLLKRISKRSVSKGKCVNKSGSTGGTKNRNHFKYFLKVVSESRIAREIIGHMIIIVAETKCN